MGIASTAPAHSPAATLGFVVATVGPQTLLLVPLAFIPMFFSAWANKEMNRAWMLSLRRSQREFFSGASMHDGYSITDDDQVVRVGAAVDATAAVD